MSIRLTMLPEEANAITHGGKFHADDIFSSVLLEKVLGNLVLYRSAANLSEIHSISSDTIVFDIGFGKFDHHQPELSYHPNTDTTKQPIPYASFGLLWKEFGMEICMQETHNDIEQALHLWDYIDTFLVIGIDANDNGIYPQSPDEYKYHKTMTVSNVISALNPDFEDSDSYIEAFMRAVSFARTVFAICISNGLNSENPTTSKYFNADQIFSYVLLKHIDPNTSIDVIYNLDAWNSIELEPHEVNRGSRDFHKKSVPLATFGRIWKLEGQKYCDSIIIDSKYPKYFWDYIRSYLVIGVDAHSNGILPTNRQNYVEYNILTIPALIESLNPISSSKKELEKSLRLAILLAELVFAKVQSEALYRLQCRPYVEEKIAESRKKIPATDRKITDSSKHLLVFDKHVHWQDWVACNPEAKDIWFVISPSNRGGYIIQPVPNQHSENGYRKGFYEKWYGLSGEKLQKETKIPTADFIYRNRGNLGAAYDLEGAIKLAEKSFPNQECKMKISNSNRRYDDYLKKERRK